jgi:hypothetical protein
MKFLAGKERDSNYFYNDTELSGKYISNIMIPELQS